MITHENELSSINKLTRLGRKNSQILGRPNKVRILSKESTLDNQILNPLEISDGIYEETALQKRLLFNNGKGYYNISGNVIASNINTVKSQINYNKYFICTYTSNINNIIKGNIYRVERTHTSLNDTDDEIYILTEVFNKNNPYKCIVVFDLDINGYKNNTIYHWDFIKNDWVGTLTITDTTLAIENNIPVFGNQGNILKPSGLTLSPSNENNIDTINNEPINIGILNSSVVNISKANTNTNIKGHLIVDGDLYVNGNSTTLNVETLEVEDKNIVLNKNGVDSSNSGILIEENNNIIGYIKTSVDKNSLLIKTPNRNGELTITNSNGNNILEFTNNGNNTIIFPDITDTLITKNTQDLLKNKTLDLSSTVFSNEPTNGELNISLSNIPSGQDRILYSNNRNYTIGTTNDWQSNIPYIQDEMVVVKGSKNINIDSINTNISYIRLYRLKVSNIQSNTNPYNDSTNWELISPDWENLIQIFESNI